MVKLRLRRMGAKKRPSYRIVAADSRSPRDGAFIESVGFYDPITDPATINVNLERARHWVSVGAQPTETVRSIFTKAGVFAAEALVRRQGPRRIVTRAARLGLSPVLTRAVVVACAASALDSDGIAARQRPAE